MSKTITIRTDDALRHALQKRATESGVTMSEVARDILWEALEERPLAERIGHLRGAISLDPGAPDWHASLRERNWRD